MKTEKSAQFLTQMKPVSERPFPDQGKLRELRGKPINPHKVKREEIARRNAEESERARKVIEAINVSPPAQAARPRRRHWGVISSLFIFVALPVFITWWYLEHRAADQFVSHVGFSVRTEEMSQSLGILGGLTQHSSASSTDTDILYEFIQGQELVAQINQKIDLRSLYSTPENDPIFTFDTAGSIEDLVRYWARMVKINYDSTAGLLELRVFAFNPDDAQQIARLIFEESSAKINELSAIARDDATRYSREELEVAISRLKNARRSITEFRTEHRLVDPESDILGQVGLLNTLQQQLIEASIELDLLSVTTSSKDPRVLQAERKVKVISARIDEERQKFAQAGSVSGKAYSVLVGDYEELAVDLEFAQESYLSALAAHDQAKAEAQRQSRYLAPFISPTLAERSTYPKKQSIILISTVFIFLSWATAVLLLYAIKDRR